MTVLAYFLYLTFRDNKHIHILYNKPLYLYKGKEGHMGKGCHERAYASYKHINACWVEFRECQNVI